MTSGQAVRPPQAVAPATAPSPWLVRRLFPVLATVGLIVIGMIGTTIVGPHLIGRVRWSLPDDLWGTLIAADRLVHLNLAGLYTQPTGLVTFPGAAVILAPVATLIDAAGLSLQHPGPHNPQPAVWLVAGPYMIAISGVALFAADALAERLRVPRWKRFFLAAASAVALWNVSVQWGHPEDAVSVGLLLFGILALSEARTARSAWLLGAAIAVQPLVLLALPILLAAIEPRRIPGFLARAAAPAAVLLGAAAAANWHATYLAVAHQPNWPTVDHPTPWTPLAPHMAAGAVADGPFRLLAILAACGCALVRRTAAAGGTARARAERGVERGNAPGTAVVGRPRPGAALRVRAGDGRLLPVAGAGGGAHRGDQDLATPARHVRHRHRGHLRVAVRLAQPVGLVGVHDRGSGADPVLRRRSVARQATAASLTRVFACCIRDTVYNYVREAIAHVIRAWSTRWRTSRNRDGARPVVASFRPSKAEGDVDGTATLPAGALHGGTGRTGERTGRPPGARRMSILL